MESFPHAQTGPETGRTGGSPERQRLTLQKISLETRTNKGLWGRGQAERVGGSGQTWHMHSRTAKLAMMSSEIFDMGGGRGHDELIWGAGGRGGAKTEELPENFCLLSWTLTPHLFSQIPRTIVR